MLNFVSKACGTLKLLANVEGTLVSPVSELGDAAARTPTHGSVRYFRLESRKDSGSASVKSTTSSPVTVLMSWCRLNTLTPVTSWTRKCCLGGERVRFPFLVECGLE